MSRGQSRDPMMRFMELKVPRFYGSVPTIFGVPIAENGKELQGYDVAFLGIPWQAPPAPGRVGAAAANFEGTNLTPQRFRLNSMKYGGYLPELDVDVLEQLRFVDYGNVDIVFDIRRCLENVRQAVGDIVDAGCIAMTMGGNGGVSSYPVLDAIASRARGRVSVVNFDAHDDNMKLSAEIRDDNRAPRWAGTWAGDILKLPNVDPQLYQHVGLRGPRNTKEPILRFLEAGVLRQHIYTYKEIAAARRDGFESLAQQIAERATTGSHKVWIAVDVDVLDMSVSPEFGDEPLGPRVEEVLEIALRVGRAAGREHLAGISFMAVPPEAMTIQWICLYMMLYLLAGMLGASWT